MDIRIIFFIVIGIVMVAMLIKGCSGELKFQPLKIENKINKQLIKKNDKQERVKVKVKKRIKPEFDFMLNGKPLSKWED
jgi:hypothetical protein